MPVRVCQVQEAIEDLLKATCVGDGKLIRAGLALDPGYGVQELANTTERLQRLRGVLFSISIQSLKQKYSTVDRSVLDILPKEYSPYHS